MDAIVSGQVNALARRLAEMEADLEIIKNTAGGNRIIDIIAEIPSLEAGAYVSLDPTMGDGTSSKFLIKMIYVEGLQGAKPALEIISSTTPERFTYYTNEVSNTVIHDVVDLPYVDDDETGKMHLVVGNLGNTATSFKVRIMGMTAQ